MADSKLRDQLEPELKALKDQTRHLSMHRNKRIAHFDYLTQENISRAEIKQVSVDEVNLVFTKMETCFNLITMHYNDGITYFDSDVNASTKNLLYSLYDGKHAQNQLRERMYGNQTTEEDYERLKLIL